MFIFVFLNWLKEGTNSSILINNIRKNNQNSPQIHQNFQQKSGLCCQSGPFLESSQPQVCFPKSPWLRMLQHHSWSFPFVGPTSLPSLYKVDKRNGLCGIRFLAGMFDCNSHSVWSLSKDRHMCWNKLAVHSPI